VAQLNKTWLDELHKLKYIYEDRLEEILKSKNKQETPDITEFQQHYLREMEELQDCFHQFKMKTYEEFRSLKKQKEEIYFKKTYYKDKYEALLVENTRLQDQIRQTSNEILNTFGNTNDVIFLLIIVRRIFIPFQNCL
jgi:hypothetical protein